jgi:hypothetical protein
LLALTLLLLLLVACGGHDGPAPASSPLDSTAEAGGATRPFLLGLSSLPAGGSSDDYHDAFTLASQAGEVVLIQRAPPWSDFLPGASISSRTEGLTRLEKEMAHDDGLKLFLAIDPTQPSDRGKLAGLPADLQGHDFSDPAIRSAFVSYAKYLALNYKPAYMALGIEVDMFYARAGDGAFRNFLSLYFEAYDGVKQVSPDTLVFPTFEYEDMLGILDTAQQRQPAWSLVYRFEPKLDLLAISSFPGLVFNSAHDVPQDYYMALKDKIDKPVAFVSVGWTSQSSTGQQLDTEQVTFLYRVLAAAQDLGAKLVIWYLGRDPQVAPTSSFLPLATMGLQDAEGQPKPAWRVWLSAEARPPPVDP